MSTRPYHVQINTVTHRSDLSVNSRWQWRIYFAPVRSQFSILSTIHLVWACPSISCSRIPLPDGKYGPHLIGLHACFCPHESTPQTTSRSVQPVLQGSRSWQTDADRPRHFVCSNKSHLATAAMRSQIIDLFLYARLVHVHRLSRVFTWSPWCQSERHTVLLPWRAHH